LKESKEGNEWEGEQEETNGNAYMSTKKEMRKNRKFRNYDIVIAWDDSV
jgi:hypothetical protein